MGNEAHVIGSIRRTSSWRGATQEMRSPRHFRVDTRRIVHETIDGETMLIDLDTGTYYCLVGSGPEIWRLLIEGWPDTEITREMRRRHPNDAEAAAAATADMIEQLRGEGLLDDGEPGLNPLLTATPTAPVDRPFAPPVLECYTDMQHFLLLDPIHEVDDAGWPHAKVLEPAHVPSNSTRSGELV